MKRVMMLLLVAVIAIGSVFAVTGYAVEVYDEYGCVLILATTKSQREVDKKIEEIFGKGKISYQYTGEDFADVMADRMTSTSFLMKAEQFYNQYINKGRYLFTVSDSEVNTMMWVTSPGYSKALRFADWINEGADWSDYGEW